MPQRFDSPLPCWTKGKHVLITGASSGIGRELARRLTKSCERLTLISRNREGKLDALKKELQEFRDSYPGKTAEVECHEADVRDARHVSELAASFYQQRSLQIDAMVCCAGGSHYFGPLERMSFQDIDDIVDVNAKATMYWLRAFLPYIRNNPRSPNDLKHGHVIVLSSRSGERALPNLSVYAGAKGCVEKFIEAVRAEYAAYGIVFTLVNPGSVNTSFTDHWASNDRRAHNAGSMTVSDAIRPILDAIDSQYAVNRVSFESVRQWTAEPGVWSSGVPEVSGLTEHENECSALAVKK